jgi:uncharacterized RDD family membrane protein YckC
MDRTLDVRTPESIAFSYELAGIGSRFLAVTLDLLIQIAILLALGFGLALVGMKGAGWSSSHAHGAAFEVKFVENVVIGFFIFVVFMIFFGYFIVFEGLWNGQTPGKKALGLRVVRDGGYPIDFMASLIRNLIRVGEMLVGYYAVSAVIALLSPENKRLGDMAAGTIVVREAKMASPQSMLRDLREEPVYAATAYVSGDERAIVKRFLERRERLEPARRVAIARQIAERVRPRLPADLQRLDDEPLLERL